MLANKKTIVTIPQSRVKDRGMAHSPAVTGCYPAANKQKYYSTWWYLVT